MAKPIAIIYFPDNFTVAGGRQNWIYEYMAYLNGEERGDNKIQWGERKDYWKDYYWFCFYDYDITKPEIKVFYEKDFTEIQYNELKELITQSLNEINNGNNRRETKEDTG
jgi:hypothetical protein